LKSLAVSETLDPSAYLWCALDIETPVTYYELPIQLESFCGNSYNYMCSYISNCNEKEISEYSFYYIKVSRQTATNNKILCT